MIAKKIKMAQKKNPLPGRGSTGWYIGTVKNSLELDEEEWGKGMKTNLNGTWLVPKHVCRRMRDGHQGGSIINISSIIGINRDFSQ